MIPLATKVISLFLLFCMGLPPFLFLQTEHTENGTKSLLKYRWQKVEKQECKRFAFLVPLFLVAI